MLAINNTAIHIMADSGVFQGFMITRKQSEDSNRYDQWRTITLEEAKAIEVAILMVANRILEERAKPTPKTKIVYEWIYKDEDGEWRISDTLNTDSELVDYKGVKTGRSWEVEV